MFTGRYRFLWSIAKPLRRSQAKTFVAISLAVIGCGRLRSFAIAQELARASGTRFKSGLQRFYRWVHNDKFDTLGCWAVVAGQLLQGAGRRPIVAVDWTEWHPGLRVLGAAVCVGRRAIPIFVQTFSKTDIPRSQNTRENGFVHLLCRLSPLMRRAVLVLDRGFRRGSLIRELYGLKQNFVVRLAAKVRVEAKAYAGLLSDYPLRPGQRVDLGVCRLGARTPTKVRLIGVWAKGQHEPWWLATNLANHKPLGPRS